MENEHKSKINKAFFIANSINGKIDTAFLPEHCEWTPPMTFCFVLLALPQNQGAVLIFQTLPNAQILAQITEYSTIDSTAFPINSPCCIARLKISLQCA